MSDYYVYIMTNRSGTLYIGVTNDIYRRVLEHRTGAKLGFTSRYQMTRLLYVETTNDVNAAIAREKQLKGWTRKRKIELARSLNPHWTDLSKGWYEGESNGEAPSSRDQILRSAQNDRIDSAPSSAGPLKDEYHV